MNSVFSKWLAIFIFASISINASAKTSPAVNPAKAPLTIAMASNFQSTMKEIAEQYQQQSGVQVRVIGAASGVLFQQIRRSAPFDLFFSADRKRPQTLVDEGLATQAKDYAQGRLAIYSQKAPLSQVLETLSAPCQVAIANPEAAPYGALAKDYINQHSQYSICKTITGANISQAFQYTAMAHVDIGFVAYSHLIDQKVDPKYYQLLEADTALSQAYAIIKKETPHPEITSFLEFLTLPSTKALIEQKGYLVIETSLVVEKSE